MREMQSRYCDTETGEEIGWLISPLLNGFYYGYLATGDIRWIDRLIDWTDAWVRRGVVEPDGYIGWPKIGAAGTSADNLDAYYADSLVGEAMALKPVVLLSAAVLADPALKPRYGEKAESYMVLAQSIFEKWERRGAWRSHGGGTITVVQPFGIDRTSGSWTEAYDRRNTEHQGLSHPNNKANIVASWLLAMFDAVGDSAYKERATQWFRLMKSRMLGGNDRTNKLWNYWEPAGAWDYGIDGKPKHWVGVHPNIGYYAIDVDSVIEAYKHHIVFNDEDIAQLARMAATQGRLWPALAPYDEATRRRFEASVDFNGWTELYMLPWYLALQTHRLK